MKNTEFNINEATKAVTMNLEIKITGIWWFDFKLKIAQKLIQLAGFVIGCKTNVTLK